MMASETRLGFNYIFVICIWSLKQPELMPLGHIDFLSLAKNNKLRVMTINYEESENLVIYTRAET